MTPCLAASLDDAWVAAFANAFGIWFEIAASAEFIVLRAMMMSGI